MRIDFSSFASSVKRNKTYILAGIIVINVFFAFQLFSLKIDNSLSVWFAKDDPVLKSYADFKRNFGNDEVIITSLEFEDPITDFYQIRKLSNLCDTLRNIQGVSRILSILDVPVSIKNNQPVFLGKYLEENPRQKKSFSVLERVQDFKSSHRFIVQENKCLVFYTWLDTIPEIDQKRKSIQDKILFQIKDIFNEEVEINQSGPGIIYDTLNRETLATVPMMMGLSYLIVLLLVFLFTRRFRWVLITFLSISFSNICLFGLMALFGSKPNMVTMAIPPLIVVIGVANIIHFAKGLEPFQSSAFDKTTSRSFLSIVIKPLLFNALTTAGGFASLSIANLQVTREYGIYASIGVLIAFVFSLLLSIILSRPGISVPKPSRWLKAIEEQVVRLMLFSAKNRKTILIISLIFIVIFSIGIFKIESDTNTADFFQKDHPIQKQINALEKQMGHFYPADFLLNYKDRNWKDKEFLLKLVSFQNKIDTDTLFGTTFSIADLLNDSYSLMRGQYQQAPGQLNSLSQGRILTLSRPIQKSEYYSQLVADKGKTIRVSVTGPIESAKTYIFLTSYFENTAHDIFGEGLTIRPAGNLPLYSQSIQYTMHDQLSSLGLAICIILILIGLLLRSFRLSLLSIPSNLIPIIFILGIMGYFNIRLDLATVTIAAAILGIIVDDTIHLLYGYKSLDSGNKSDLELIRELAHHKGPALVFTSIILCSGFIVIGLAGLRAIARPGWLIALAVFIALITDIFLLPALLIRRKKDSSHSKYSVY